MTPADKMNDTSEIFIDLAALSAAADGNGPLWGCALDDLNLTLLCWDEHGQVAPHVNNEVDVVFIGVAGQGEVTVNGETFLLSPGKALLIAKGSERAVRSATERFSYLSVHRRRAGLMPAPIKRATQE